MFHAILKQINHPENYSAKHLRRQVAVWILSNPVKALQVYDPALSSHSCLRDFAIDIEDDMWGDVTTLCLIALMWDCAITILNYTGKSMNLFHNKDKPDIVLLYHSTFHYQAAGMQHKYLFVTIFSTFQII